MVSELHRSNAAVVVIDPGVGEGTSTEDATVPPSVSKTAANRSHLYRTEDFDNPLYLHITENPNQTLVSPPLSKSNYASWSRSMKMALGVKNKFRFVDGTIACPGEADPRKYTLEILKNNGFLEAKPTKTPAVTRQKLNSQEGVPLTDPEVYRKLVGKLLYLTNTRPDISHSVQHLSQFVDKPTNIHLTAAHRVLRYLKGSPGKGLFYPSNTNLKLQGFSDSDWATRSEIKKSITGYCVYIGKVLISWRTKKQATVSRSSSEAEYRALASTVSEIQWLHYLLTDLDVLEVDAVTREVNGFPVFTLQVAFLSLHHKICYNRFSKAFILFILLAAVMRV
ncbi:PREDICTED: uncharacterized protein LOC109162748 [Ipomoea nil]|uniref:uncharacterized protein LOC109162748 n=1 Tax=Ipomoea nil TaxID=35883 RepID=UPI0009019F1A|nr:PREDICTED: uncharacterized protein LOC109162748 [Ipomoea nil]